MPALQTEGESSSSVIQKNEDLDSEVGLEALVI